ncbi:MAG: aminotransferase class I/II-fold pyridoxal phosphate-dependent enzyme [Candidatus Puniceispirillum sp.]|nr:aminotransferase class I/II-fold pyridoxal phosphate-dependent enzyme [Candidatus Puniceispirillum sp.]MBL6775156.1 aminotransferase class I/II-fold pyridoxal phosphate-dependent enzyme [Candidatus Puniceispirillum sp.]
MTQAVFRKPFTQQEGIPEAGIKRAVEIMQTGRLHRYNLLPDEVGEVAALEMEYAKWQGADYCVACASGGYAIQLGLRICGVKPGDKVLANAYTLAPVPGAIHNVGAVPVLVDIDENYHIDCNDLDAKAAASGAKHLLLSYMRGHIPDMDRVLAVCAKHDISIIEDCAHTMGAKWRGIRSGNFGKVAAFSTQTYKHMNSGEGGFLTTNDAELAAVAVVSSGSYMLYGRHGAIPAEEVFQKVRLHAPNYSGRMDHLRAAILRAQLPMLEDNLARWNQLYERLYGHLSAMGGVMIPPRKQEEFYVGSSIQFRADALAAGEVPDFVAACAKRGVELKWFGDAEPKAFTSRYDSWRYIDDIPVLPTTLRVLEKTLDMRVPLTFTIADCDMIAEIINDEIQPFLKN